MDDAEYRAVSALDAGKRYNHLVARIADWQWIWVLEDDEGLVVQADGSGTRHAPIWPHRRYAEANAIGAWCGARPRAIEVHEWVEVWLPGLEDDGLMLTAFPTPEHQGHIVSPLRMRAELEEELSRYE